MPFADDKFGDPLDDILSPSGGQEILDDPTNEPSDGQSQIDPNVLALAQQSGQNQVVQEMMKDKDFQEFYRMKHSGKAFKLVPVDPSDPNSQQTQGQGQQNQQQAQMAKLDFKNMTPEQVVAALTPLIKQQAKAELEPQTQQLQQTLQQFQGYISQQESERVAQDIQATQQKYPDFAEYRQGMSQLVNTYPAANAEELYMLAKLKARRINPGQKGPIATERPMGQNSRPTGQTRQPQPTGPVSRAQAFNSAFDRAFGRTNIPNID